MRLRHRLKWITQAGEEWLDESREIILSDLNPTEGFYSLHWTIQLKNISNRTLSFGSPTTEGRENAGYGGLFWRGPREFTGGQLFSEKAEGDATMGQRSSWCAFVGGHDGQPNGPPHKSTIVFIDRPGNVSYPIKWFARTKEYACLSTSFSFDSEVPLEAGKDLLLNYRTLFANGAWDKKRIEGYVAALK